MLEERGGKGNAVFNEIAAAKKNRQRPNSSGNSILSFF
jgi:hypothetical protein